MAEATSAVTRQLDLLANEEIVELMLRAEERVVPAVRAAAGSISAASSLLAERLVAGAAVTITPLT